MNNRAIYPDELIHMLFAWHLIPLYMYYQYYDDLVIYVN